MHNTSGATLKRVASFLKTFSIVLLLIYFYACAWYDTSNYKQRINDERQSMYDCSQTSSNIDCKLKEKRR